MGALFDMLMFLGSSVCHQLPERSYIFDDLQMPLCARCAGIHIGFLFSTVFLWAGARRFSSSLPSKNSLIILGGVMSLFFVDAVLSYSGALPSDNLRRTLSGLALGVPLPFVLVPLMNISLLPGRQCRPLLSTASEWMTLGLLYLVGACAVLAATGTYATFVAVSILGVVGVFFTFSVSFSSALSLALEGKGLGASALLSASVVLAVAVLMILAILHGEYPSRV